MQPLSRLHELMAPTMAPNLLSFDLTILCFCVLVPTEAANRRKDMSAQDQGKANIYFTGEPVTGVSMPAAMPEVSLPGPSLAEKEEVVSEIIALYADNSQYGGLSQHLHGCQAAQQAVDAGYDDATIVAALLHDIGWKLARTAPWRPEKSAAGVPTESLAHELGILSFCGIGGDADEEQRRAQHDVVGATYLRMRGFSEKVCFLSHTRRVCACVSTTVTAIGTTKYDKDCMTVLTLYMERIRSREYYLLACPAIEIRASRIRACISRTRSKTHSRAGCSPCRGPRVGQAISHVQGGGLLRPFVARVQGMRKRAAVTLFRYPRKRTEFRNGDLSPLDTPVVPTAYILTATNILPAAHL